MPRIMTEKSGEPPSKKVIDTWFISAKIVMESEDLDWIVNLTHTMWKNEDTEEYYIKHPSGRKLLLEEETFDTIDNKDAARIPHVRRTCDTRAVILNFFSKKKFPPSYSLSS